jgi:hypothetical protein
MLKEVAGHHGAARLQVAAEVSAFARTIEYVLLVCEHAAQRGMCAKTMREHDALAPAHIHEASPGSDLVSCVDRETDEPGHVCHGAVEDAGSFGIAPKMFKAVGAESKADPHEVGVDEASFIACAR